MQSSQNNLYLFLVLVVCLILLLPYLGILDFSSSDQVVPAAPRMLRREMSGIDDTREKQEEQKKRLAEIEQMLH